LGHPPKRNKRLAGTIDETSDLDRLLLNLPTSYTINCKKVERVNCAGVRNWMKFFRAQATKNAQYKFIECSPALVDQLNLVRAFPCGGEVVSVYLPYVCAPCKAQFFQLMPVQKLKLIYRNLPSPTCPKCTKAAQFDDVASAYFHFLDSPQAAA
jgi:DNA-directed RNA polymerase subunit RPC12/RpoP